MAATLGFSSCRSIGAASRSSDWSRGRVLGRTRESPTAADRTGRTRRRDRRLWTTVSGLESLPPSRFTRSARSWLLGQASGLSAAQKTVWSKPLSEGKTAAQACKSAWGWGTHASFRDVSRPRFSALRLRLGRAERQSKHGLRNRFSERMGRGESVFMNTPD
jgi:hypothetical protein